MTVIRYKLHFATLALAVPLLWIIQSSEMLTGRGLFVGYAPLGVLHATSLVISLRRDKRIALRFAFVVLAGVVSGLAPLAGLLGAWPMIALTGVIFSRWPGLQGPINFLTAFAVGSAFGASVYWLLVRWFWIKMLSGAHLRTTIIACVSATLASWVPLYLLGRVGASFGLYFLLPTVAWWFAFSGSLYWSETRGHAAQPTQVTSGAPA